MMRDPLASRTRAFKFELQKAWVGEKDGKVVENKAGLPALFPNVTAARKAVGRKNVRKAKISVWVLIEA